MKKIYRPLISSIFIIVVAIDCFLIVNKLGDYRNFTRPLLVPILYVLLAVESNDTTHKKSKLFITFALLFSFLSDLLLFYNAQDAYFILGLISFFLARVWYMVFFLHLKPFSTKRLPFIILAGLFITGYLCLLLNYMWSGIVDDSFAVAAVFFAIITGTLVLSAMHTFSGKRIKKLAYRNFIPGTLLLLAADSILLASKYWPFPPETDKTILGDFARLTIALNVATVSLAQLLIVLGALRIIKK